MALLLEPARTGQGRHDAGQERQDGDEPQIIPRIVKHGWPLRAGVRARDRPASSEAVLQAPAGQATVPRPQSAPVPARADLATNWHPASSARETASGTV